MDLTRKGLDLIERFEGLRLNTYSDIAGHETIGYGHLIKPGESFITISESEAEDLLIQDLGIAMRAVRRNINRELTNNQFSALVSFTYNLGAGLLQRSTLRMRVNAGDMGGAANAFLMYCYAGGMKSRGLLRRRYAEMELFLSADQDGDGITIN